MQEQSRLDAEKLIANMISLVSDCMRRQREMVCFYVFNHHFFLFEDVPVFIGISNHDI